jgi:GT2 family glycosyltransferase
VSNSNGPRIRGGGTIGVVSSDLARYSDFCLAMSIMAKPADARIIWTKTTDVVGNCNAICRKMIGDWVWIMGDDHVFNPDILLRLLEHDVDIVVPLVFTRTPPYKPVVMSREVGLDEHGHVEYEVAWLPETGLHEVHAAGSAGMLIRRHVLDAVGDPWFATDGKGLNEDLAFCRRAREAGARIYCDVDVQMGHIAPHTIWPEHRDGGWHPNLILDPQTVVPLRNIEAPEAELV